MSGLQVPPPHAPGNNNGGQQPGLTSLPGGGLGKLCGVECADVIWSDLLVMDEESGSNRQHGFLFLYDLLKGDLR
jgi:hypothetical protein